MNDTYDPDFAAVVIRLMKGPLYDNEPLWSQMITLKKNVNDYLSRIGLILFTHEEDGFAYICHPKKDKNNEEAEADEEDGYPRLVRRIPLSFEVSLLCVILREELERFDISNAESSRLFLDMQEIRERIRIYFKEKTDETRLIRKLESYIHQVENLGYIKKISTGDDKLNQDSRYEVMRIIKARVNPDFLIRFKQKLEEYVNTL